ncbi:Fe-S cluster assembly protein SufD [Candidatus Palauibacter sp.]|uniref:Fe-S cluster assembly protein SufD n=1 Tax=Candidatus Palauibacter sp. TaxID=3101350 RepID=UPI003B52F5C7
MSTITAGPAESTLAAADFDTLSGGLTEPDVIAAARAAAWARFTSLPWPTKKSEEWRYTDLTKVGFEALTPVVPAPATAETLSADVREVLGRSGERAGVVVLREGRVAHLELEPEVAGSGVVLSSIRDAADRHPEVLRHALLDAQPGPAEEKLWALHLALLGGGYFLYVPRGVEMPAPIHAFHIVERAGTLSSAHSFVYGESGARAAVIDEFFSDDLDAETVSLHGATITGEGGAGIDYVALQRFGRGVKRFSTQHVVAGRDSRVVTFNVALGGDLSRADITSRLDGPGSDSEMLALWFGDSDQHFDHHTLQHHAAPHAHSDLLFKGALTDAGSSVFRGLIRVDKGAQLTDAYQTNRNLLLSERSHASALPNLEIEADDVRCSHGATIGQVEDGQLFYLMSRGLTRRQAERLLVFGFFDEVLGRLPMEGVRARVREAIEEKIGL